ncbi:leucine-rich repeat-containing protein 34 isoform X2 [Betta splendens]|uniref:Leucine-rich repeat-containing protein 34 isoform X2 n=1 Tax=Betta splendens TaxID=158456 RepID=A0A6P7M4F5_BETSP|nr:leucine-rich repeat-containing protein 34 isoform X2 [Betta splendens]
MANESMSESYKSACSDNQIKRNPHIAEVLEKLRADENVTLKLPGNKQRQRLHDEDAMVLCKCLQNNKCVTGLDLRYNNISDEGVERLSGLLQEDSSLLSLDLMFNDILAGGAEILSTVLQSNTTLRSLALSGNKLGSRGAVRLAGMLQRNHSLQELQLADCDLGVQGVIALTIALKSNTGLLSLDLSRALLSSLQEWAVHVSEMLVGNSHLVELHLGRMGMTDAGMERLADGLTSNYSLRYLDLRCNRVTRDGVSHLAKVLKLNPTLEVVDLSFNRMEDEGAVYLSEAITSPGCGLRELSVKGNSISAEGLLSLAQATGANTRLTHLYIWGNHLEEPVCHAFRELMSSGRLLPEQTDVSVYEVDGRVFLAEAPHSLRRRYNSSRKPTHIQSLPPN